MGIDRQENGRRMSNLTDFDRQMLEIEKKLDKVASVRFIVGTVLVTLITGFASFFVDSTREKS